VRDRAHVIGAPRVHNKVVPGAHGPVAEQAAQPTREGRKIGTHVTEGPQKFERVFETLTVSMRPRKAG
jgi:hypothetical protein